jgi:hypothetical protein
VHEVATSLNPQARVVYVDVDPVAVAHSRALLAQVPGAAVVQADARDTAKVLAEADTTGLLDLSRPLAVMMVALLHFIPDEDDPAGMVAAYRDAVAPGSFLTLSHATLDGNAEAMRDHEEIYRRSATPIHGRNRAQITGLFDGYGLVDPGVVYLPLWRPEPDEAPATKPERYSGYAAVGRLP